jgi:hypothetical protein
MISNHFFNQKAPLNPVVTGSIEFSPQSLMEKLLTFQASLYHQHQLHLPSPILTTKTNQTASQTLSHKNAS